MPTETLRVWRPAQTSLFAIATGGLLFGGVCVLVGVGLLDGGPGNSFTAHVVFVIVGILALAAAAQATLAQRVELSVRELRVVNLLRTTVIPLVDLETAHPSRYGLMLIWSRDGRSVQTCASAVQKAAIPEAWRRSPARADEVIDEIRRQCESAHR